MFCTLSPTWDLHYDLFPAVKICSWPQSHCVNIRTNETWCDVKVSRQYKDEIHNQPNCRRLNIWVIDLSILSEQISVEFPSSFIYFFYTSIILFHGYFWCLMWKKTILLELKWHVHFPNFTSNGKIHVKSKVVYFTQSKPDCHINQTTIFVNPTSEEK